MLYLLYYLLKIYLFTINAKSNPSELEVAELKICEILIPNKNPEISGLFAKTYERFLAELISAWSKKFFITNFISVLDNCVNFSTSLIEPILLINLPIPYPIPVQIAPTQKDAAISVRLPPPAKVTKPEVAPPIIIEPTRLLGISKSDGFFNIFN